MGGIPAGSRQDSIVGEFDRHYVRCKKGEYGRVVLVLVGKLNLLLLQEWGIVRTIKYRKTILVDETLHHTLYLSMSEQGLYLCDFTIVVELKEENQLKGKSDISRMHIIKDKRSNDLISRHRKPRQCIINRYPKNIEYPRRQI